MRKIEYSIKELCDLQYKTKKMVIPLGYANNKKLYYIDLEKMSGLFIAGATGTGKSVFIDDLIVGLMYKNKPTDVNFIMLDPKKIELGEYDGINHLIGKKSQSNSLKGYDMLLNLLKILDFRINLIKRTHHRTISGYNRDEEVKLPHIFVIVDEGCNIIKMKDSYTVFSKILDFGECVGVHLIFATNSYLKDYADSNFIDKFKFKVAFDLTSEEQAKYIDIKNSNWLKSNGVALIKNSNGKIFKFQAPMVDDEEINEIVLQNKK